MANPEHVEIVKQGEVAIAEWRGENAGILFDLIGADLSGADLSGANLSGANLSGAKLSRVDLSFAQLNDASLQDVNLIGANLNRADLTGVYLSGADLSSAYLSGADLRGADLSGANLRAAYLSGVNLSRARLSSAELGLSHFRDTHLDDVDLSAAKGLSDVLHDGPSHIDHATLARCAWKLPTEFLRGCGFAPWEVTHARMYDPAITPAQFAELQAEAFVQRMTGPLFLGGIFISYSRDDSKFVDKLYKRHENDGANVWLDRHDMLAGATQKQVNRAIRLNDIVLLVLSETSIESDWVEHELEQARQKEKQEGRDVLCPVALDESWKRKVDGDVLWRQLKKKNILDFSEWETEAFDEPFAKLLKGLKVNYPRPAKSS